jgi:soluble lytic murein transglycosylase-like protein
MRYRKQNQKSVILRNLFLVSFLFLGAMLIKIYLIGDVITEDSNIIQRLLLDATIEKKSILEIQVHALTEQAQKEKQVIEELMLALDELKHNQDSKEEEIQSLQTYIERLKIGQTSTNVNHIISQKIDNAIEKASTKHGVEKALIRAIIKQESNFNVNALSHANAQGLMQIIPGTAKLLGITNVWDIEQNIDGGTRYIKDQLNTFGDLRLALAAYNAGPNNVRKYKGVPPFRETQDYVVKVISYYNAFK